jgi:ABC-type polar amino acid transport system ATPase subunit
MASVAIHRVTKAFGSIHVIHDVNVEIADGEFVVLVGPSKAYPADSGSSICSRGVDPAWLTLLHGLSRLMMSQ